MQKGVILGCGNRSNAGMDTVTLVLPKSCLTIGFNYLIMKYICALASITCGLLLVYRSMPILCH
jgi:hypothetical protein